MSDNSDKPMICVPDMCRAHQAEMVNRLHIPESGPWRAHIVVMNVRLFQAASTNQKVWERCSLLDDGTRDERDLSLVLAEIGRLACFDRRTFGETLALMRTNGLAHVSRLVREFKGDIR